MTDLMQAGKMPFISQVKGMLGLSARGEPIPIEDRAILTDISHWQGNVNFQQMQLAGAMGSIAKCTQGTTLPDDKYASFVAGCTNIPLGSYHFMLNSNGTAQADYYTQHLQQHAIPFTHWCDVEQSTLKSSYIYQWAVRVKNNLHMADYSKIGIYTSAYFWSLVVDDGYKAWCSRYLMLWVAHYGTDYPLMPSGWSDYVIHQYDPNGDGHLYGCDSAGVDLNRCRKSWLAQFLPNQPPLTLEERVERLEKAVFG